MGKAKFGIFGDGKELAQVAMAQAFENGDCRAGYYRDQTLMLALGLLEPAQFFAQLYAHADVIADPASGGRMMNAHFATRMLDKQGRWVSQTSACHSTADISPTAGQMPRLLGLAYASKLYRLLPELAKFTDFSNQGKEIAWGTIGNASTSEGLFFETFNAAGVLQVPMVLSVWDDAYGISVPASYHTVKQSISQALEGFRRDAKQAGWEIYQVPGWDYPQLCAVYKEAAALARKSHVPVLVHVIEMTQPQGHSTSGSHERYKSKERLDWEQAHDCLLRLRSFGLEEGLADAKQLDALEEKAIQAVKTARDEAWEAYLSPIVAEKKHLLALIDDLLKVIAGDQSGNNRDIVATITSLRSTLAAEARPLRRDLLHAARQALVVIRGGNMISEAPIQALNQWVQTQLAEQHEVYRSHLYAPLDNPKIVEPTYSKKEALVDGREVLCAAFDSILQRDPRFFAIGEDLGFIGDVNQGFAGLQQKHGLWRVTDTGIREATIIGQGIGAAMRGLRPLVEIQYLDYLLYAIQTLSDDVATLLYRTTGGQQVPLIVRTRGHRLEGIWHSGSPMGMIIHALRGMYILVPRNMTRAAAFYNTLLDMPTPALVIECLNGYRLKECLPKNIANLRYPLGIPECLRVGKDLTLVTYGSLCRMAMDAAAVLQAQAIDIEIIDVQTLVPFDIEHRIALSLEKTGRLLVLDEDVPGGASAYILQQIVETQRGYYLLDAAPQTLTAQAHRPAYGSDGDYFSKPSVEDIIEVVYEIMHESCPKRYP